MDYSVATREGFPYTEVEIVSPASLRQVLRSIRECLLRGELFPVERDGKAGPLSDVTAIPPEGPWPDFIVAYFTDAENMLEFKSEVQPL